ncbi:hypothetical protein INR49_025918 [Caranx melampygus]|nr:hypothetical protein INR49_025918 [Caranx melampygus]
MAGISEEMRRKMRVDRQKGHQDGRHSRDQSAQQTIHGPPGVLQEESSCDEKPTERVVDKHDLSHPSENPVQQLDYHNLSCHKGRCMSPVKSPAALQRKEPAGASPCEGLLLLPIPAVTRVYHRLLFLTAQLGYTTIHTTTHVQNSHTLHWQAGVAQGTGVAAEARGRVDALHSREAGLHHTIACWQTLECSREIPDRLHQPAVQMQLHPAWPLLLHPLQVEQQSVLLAISQHQLVEISVTLRESKSDLSLTHWWASIRFPGPYDMHRLTERPTQRQTAAGVDRRTDEQRQRYRQAGSYGCPVTRKEGGKLVRCEASSEGTRMSRTSEEKIPLFITSVFLTLREPGCFGC